MQDMTTIQSLAPAIDSFVPELQKTKRVAGYTLSQLSELSGVPLSNINKFFSGALAEPKLFNTAAICRLLNFSLDEHFGISATADSRVKPLKLELEALTAEAAELRRENERLAYTLESQAKELDIYKSQVDFKERQMLQKDKLLDERADFLRLKDSEIASKTSEKESLARAVKWLGSALAGSIAAIFYLLIRGAI